MNCEVVLDLLELNLEARFYLPEMRLQTHRNGLWQNNHRIGVVRNINDTAEGSRPKQRSSEVQSNMNGGIKDDFWRGDESTLNRRYVIVHDMLIGAGMRAY